jgi:hypothetical protein
MLGVYNGLPNDVANGVANGSDKPGPDEVGWNGGDFGNDARKHDFGKDLLDARSKASMPTFTSRVMRAMSFNGARFHHKLQSRPHYSHRITSDGQVYTAIQQIGKYTIDTVDDSIFQERTRYTDYTLTFPSLAVVTTCIITPVNDEAYSVLTFFFCMLIFQVGIIL